MKRKAVSGLLALSMIMTLSSGITPVLAADSTQETTQTGTQSATVTYEQESAFTVTIPKSIALGSNKQASYEVNVKGDIAGNETITVTPDATVTLNDSNGKAAVTGNITQETTEFAAATVNLPDGGGTTGSIVTNDLSAGNWSGTFNFVIELNAKERITFSLETQDGKNTYTVEKGTTWNQFLDNNNIEHGIIVIDGNQLIRINDCGYKFELTDEILAKDYTISYRIG